MLSAPALRMCVSNRVISSTCASIMNTIELCPSPVFGPTTK